MDKTKFHSIVKEYIREFTSPEQSPTIKRSELKAVIKETLRNILKEVKKKKLKEITTTGAVSPISLPGNATNGWVSKRGGSMKAVNASPTGMSLTPIGAEDMRKLKQDPV